MVSAVNGSLLVNYLNAQTTTDLSGAGGQVATAPGNTSAATNASADVVSQAALQRAASAFKNATRVHALEDSQKALAKDLQGAMGSAGVKLAGCVDFSLSSNDTVEIKSSDADKAAVKAFLNADKSTPSFVNRIASQAKDAIQLSSTIQQHAAISQAAKFGGTSGGVTALYTSLMQHANATAAVFSVSANTSSLTYPGSLTAQA